MLQHIRSNHHQPKVIYQDSSQNRQIIGSLPLLHRAFMPTPWLFNAHTQLIFHGLRKGKQKLVRDSASLYDHQEQLTMRDGGITALYWLGYNLPSETPTIVVMHTITGSPDSMVELVRDLHQGTGWRIVLCLRRGHGHLPLKTPRINLMGCTEDLREQLNVITHRFPQSPLYAVGSSAGSGLLVRYLGEEGNNAPFRACFAYCPGYDIDQSFDVVHPWYSRMMAKKLVKQFILPNQRHIAHFKTAKPLVDVENLAALYKTLYEFAGYSDYATYNAANNPMYVFDAIKTPLMVLNAEDDPVCRIDNLKPWLKTIQTMPNVLLVTTKHGSHCAHYEGWSARSWSARLMSQYFLLMANQA